jgi:ribulose bisphosphate carboxylase small subunit
LFTEEQTRTAITDITADAIPARGAIEAKATSADAWKTAESKQVRSYWARYRQVLVTNYRDFVLVGADEDGKCTVLETYRLAPDEEESGGGQRTPSNSPSCIARAWRSS